jgi:hypothetical protein
MLVEFLSNNTVKCKTQVFESLIAYILAVDQDFLTYASHYLPYLLENISNTDFNTRKITVDVLYTIAKIIP